MGLNKRLIDRSAGVSITNTDHFTLDTYAADHVDPRSFTTGFAVDFVVIKHYSTTVSESPALWAVHDNVRGNCYELHFNQNYAQNCDADSIRSFDSTGFTTGDNYTVNWNAGNNYVYYAWKGGGSGTSNTDGSLTTTVSANVEAGFSIIQYTDDGTTNTIGHGLSSAPELWIVKRYNSAQDWYVGSTAIAATQAIKMNSSDAAYTTGGWQNTYPDSSVININIDTGNYICYAFHSVPGYQKIGSYSGTSTTNAISIGFQPRFVMIKKTSGADDWVLYDSARGEDFKLRPNQQSFQESRDDLDFTSTGFTLNGSYGLTNASGQDYLYWAIA